MTPDYSLTTKEGDKTQNFKSRLIKLILTDNRGYSADTLNITLDDAEGNLMLPARGVALEFSLGWKGGALTKKGTFIVDTVTHSGSPDTVQLNASSADLRGIINTPKEKAWHDTTLGQIAEQIAKDNKLKVSVNSELAAIPVAHVDQSKESDLSFMSRIAQQFGGEMTIKQGMLFILKPGAGVVAGGQRLPTATIRRSEGDKYSFSIADRDAVTCIIVNILDTSKPKRQTSQVVLTRKQPPAPALSSSHPATQGSLQKQTQSDAEYLAGKEGNTKTLEKSFKTKEEAIIAAKAEWEKSQRESAKFSLLLAQGREALSPDTPVKLDGFKEQIDQHDWTITTLTHTLSKQGFTTKVDLELAIDNIEYEVTEIEKTT
jgi:hypothetical protein